MAHNISGVNGPRPKARAGRNRQSLTNIRSKQRRDPSALQRKTVVGAGQAEDAVKPNTGLVKEIQPGLEMTPSEMAKRVREAATRRTPSEIYRADLPLQSSAQTMVGGTNSMNQAASFLTATGNAAAALANAQRKGGEGGGSSLEGGSGGSPGQYKVTAADRRFMQRMGSGYMADPGQAERMFEVMAAKRRFSEREINMAKAIIEGGRGVDIPESNWDIHADNPTSTAGGIPQRLQSVHGNWTPKEWDRAKPQLNWYINYLLTHKYPTGTGVKHAYKYKKRTDVY